MRFNIEKAAKQIAVLGPVTQAKLFESLARLMGQSSLQALAEHYQHTLAQADSTSTNENAKASATPKPYPTADETASRQPNQVGENVAVYGSPPAKVFEADKKYEELYVTFDGETLRPEAKVGLEINTRYKVLIEKPVSRFPEIKNRALRRIAERAIPMGIRDFAEQHDHYIYGVPKK